MTIALKTTGRRTMPLVIAWRQLRWRLRLPYRNVLEVGDFFGKIGGLFDIPHAAAAKQNTDGGSLK